MVMLLQIMKTYSLSLFSLGFDIHFNVLPSPIYVLAIY